MNLQNVHDVLIIPSNRKVYRLTPDPIEPGSYQNRPAAELGVIDKGYRKITGIARKNDDGRGTRGPAFATLPNKPDASASQVCCYLINAENFSAANPWTQTEWSSEPDGEDKGLKVLASPAQAGVADAAVELVIATGSGRVYLLSFEEGGVPRPVLSELAQLNLEGEIYEQLRNGLVAGSVWVQQAQKIVPVVNISSLVPGGDSAA